MGLGDYRGGRDLHDEPGTSPGGYGGGGSGNGGSGGYTTATPTSQADRVQNVGTLNIDVEKYKDFIKDYDKTWGQKERVQAVGTTEIPYQGPEAPFDLKTPMGLAKFFGSFTGIESGLETVGSAFKFNYDRQQALRKKIMADYGVDEAGAKSIIDKSGLNITDIYGSGTGGTGAGGTEGLLTMTGGTMPGDYADPFSMFGSPGGGYPTTPEGSAAASIQQQELQRKIVETLYDPYYKSATEGALPQLMAMATGEGEVDYTPSKLYEYSKEKGERNIRRKQAARGLLESSATKDITAEFGADIAGEEAERLYAGQLSRLQMGAGAADAVTSASQTLGGNVGAIYSSLGGQKASEQLALGQSRASVYQGLSNTLSGLAKYMASR